MPRSAGGGESPLSSCFTESRWLSMSPAAQPSSFWCEPSLSTPRGPIPRALDGPPSQDLKGPHMTVYAEASPQQTSSPVTRKSLPRKAMYGLGLGNTLEWYDWQIFGLLAAFIGPQFFAPGDPVSATLSALAVFAVGFAVRPLGGVVLGMVADRIGRRTVMLLSISMMAISTLVIAVLPTYEQIGVWAGIILLITRLVQGISTGIEAPLSTAYAVELSPPGRRVHELLREHRHPAGLVDQLLHQPFPGHGSDGRLGLAVAVLLRRRTGC